MYPQMPQELHLRAEQPRSTWCRKAGGCAGAMLLGDEFRIGILAALVRDGWPRRAVILRGWANARLRWLATGRIAVGQRALE